MTFAHFYDSFYQHPLLLWAAAGIGLALALSQPGLSTSVRRFCVFLTGVSVLDAWLTTNVVPGVGRLTGSAASLVPLFFVLFGDFRYFIFIESGRSDGTLRFSATAIAKACGWTLLVPVAAQLTIGALGAEDPRVLFLVYEVFFASLASAIFVRYLPRHGDALQWTRPVTLYVIGYYTLWATADAIILSTDSDFGFLLRVLPNVLYYGGLVPVIARCAPRAAAR